VDFVDDDGAHAAEVFAGLASGEENVEGLGCSDEDVGRVAKHGSTFFGESVAGAYGSAYLRAEIAALHGQLLDLGQRGVKVFLYVVGEGFQGADVNDLRAGGELAEERRAEKLVDAD
jgi:hypothetical protein